MSGTVPVIVGLSWSGRSLTQKDRRAAVCDLGTRTHRLGGGPPGGVREHGVNLPQGTPRSLSLRLPSPRRVGHRVG